MQVKEHAASLLKTSQQREIEADELRRELERAKVEHVSRQQLVVSGGGRAQTSSPLSAVSSNVRMCNIYMYTCILPV